MSRDCCVALPHDATGLPAVSDCGISWSYSLTFCVWSLLCYTVLSVLFNFAITEEERAACLPLIVFLVLCGC